MSFELFMFLVTAAIALAGGVGMIVARNTVHSALFLLLNFFAIAVLFLLLHSPFLFAIQLTIYAGAIMVLFLFVVMLLGVESIEDRTKDRLAGQLWLSVVLTLILMVQAITITLLAEPAESQAQNTALLDQLADPALIGATLFTTYLLPFQITGVILLVGIVGVVVLHQRAHLYGPLSETEREFAEQYAAERTASGQPAEQAS
ncbi:MAG: NADH-quinone oxidoreductase subunit J [Chloroflexaceae bacterium]|nr:NADH-quinone oxidoreductase subunit J [Chloroflexaceae bacterium]